MILSFSAGMPMPVSTTWKATTAGSRRSAGFWKRLRSAIETTSRTSPTSVNFTALDSRLRRICCSRRSSVCRLSGTRSSTSMVKPSPLSAVSGPHRLAT